MAVEKDPKKIKARVERIRETCLNQPSVTCDDAYEQMERIRNKVQARSRVSGTAKRMRSSGGRKQPVSA